MLDLSVIILQKNEALHIKRCLEKLAPLEPRQIFVVDCFSTDGSDKTAAEMGASDRFSTIAVEEHNLLEGDMEELCGEINRGEQEKPVIIVEQAYGEANITEERREDPKWQLICEFMEEYGYTKTFENGKFIVYEE